MNFVGRSSDHTFDPFSRSLSSKRIEMWRLRTFIYGCLQWENRHFESHVPTDADETFLRITDVCRFPGTEHELKDKRDFFKFCSISRTMEEIYRRKGCADEDPRHLHWSARCHAFSEWRLWLHGFVDRIPIHFRIVRVPGDSSALDKSFRSDIYFRVIPSSWEIGASSNEDFATEYSRTNQYIRTDLVQCWKERQRDHELFDVWPRKSKQTEFWSDLASASLQVSSKPFEYNAAMVMSSSNEYRGFSLSTPCLVVEQDEDIARVFLGLPVWYASFKPLCVNGGSRSKSRMDSRTGKVSLSTQQEREPLVPSEASFWSSMNLR